MCFVNKQTIYFKSLDRSNSYFPACSAASFAAAMSALVCLVAAAVFVYVVVYYGVFRGSKCCSSVRLDGKTAIVTGNETRPSAAANTLASF